MRAHYNPKMFFILQPNRYYQVVRALISFPLLINVESLGVGETEASETSSNDNSSGNLKLQSDNANSSPFS